MTEATTKPATEELTVPLASFPESAGGLLSGPILFMFSADEDYEGCGHIREGNNPLGRP